MRAGNALFDLTIPKLIKKGKEINSIIADERKHKSVYFTVKAQAQAGVQRIKIFPFPCPCAYACVRFRSVRFHLA